MKNENGETISPDSVLGDPIPASAVAYLYYPTFNHFKSLTSKLEKETRFNYKNENSSKNEYFFAVVIHIIGEVETLESNEFKNFVSSFSKETLHFIDCEEVNYKYMINDSKLNYKYVLNLISSKLFKNDYIKKIDTFPNKNLNDIIDFESVSVLECKPGIEYILYPLNSRKFVKTAYSENPYYYDSKEFLSFNSKLSKQTHKINAINSELDTDKIGIKTSKDQKLFYLDEPELTFLGTISMKPGLQRNVSSIMLSIGNNKNSDFFEKFHILMDCGEGTYQQILTHYGEKNANKIIGNLKVIFITHKHGDHMLGLPKILQAVDDNYKSNINDSDLKIFIVVPKTVKRWINNLINSLYSKHLFVIIDCQDINPNVQKLYDKFVKQNDPYKGFKDVDLIKDMSELNKKTQNLKLKINELKNISEEINIEVINSNENSYIKNLQKFYFFCNKQLKIDIFSVEVFHCNDSYGCIIQSENFNNEYSEVLPWKISYSGDTRPCNNFINYSINSTAVIHEATLDDDLADDAKNKLHCTFNEACSIAKAGNSGKTILTHFSPRYLKESPWVDYFEQQKILVANDYLNIKLEDLNWAYAYGKEANKVLKNYFGDGEDEISKVLKEKKLKV